MFDFKIIDIFSTICIGLLTVLLIIYFRFIFLNFFWRRKLDIPRFFTWLNGRKELLPQTNQNSYAILALVGIYCLGVIAGDLTQRMSDSDDLIKNPVLTRLRTFCNIRRQTDTRWDALLDTNTVDKDQNGNIYGYDLNAMGKCVFSSKDAVANANLLAGTNFFTGKGSIEAQWVLMKHSVSGGPLKRDFNNFIQQIYYTGKNWCYSKSGEPLTEMKDISSRIDLARSMVLLMMCSTTLLITLIVAKLVLVIMLKLSRRRTHPNVNFFSVARVKQYLQLEILAYFFILFTIGFKCYSINEDNFNKRAFGYYISDMNQLKYMKSMK